MEELCVNCGHSKLSHPSCIFCSCISFKSKDEGLEDTIQTDDWCVDCGHHKNIHDIDIETHMCNHWAGSCKCDGFISRSEALRAVSELKDSVSKSQVLNSLRKLEEEIRGG